MAYKAMGTLSALFLMIYSIAGWADATLQKKIAFSADEEAIRNGWQEGFKKIQRNVKSTPLSWIDLFLPG